MKYLCAGFIYKGPRLSREGIDCLDRVRGRTPAPPFFPLAFPTLQEAVILTTKSRDKCFHTHLNDSVPKNDKLQTCFQVCLLHSQNAHQLHEKAGPEPAPLHPPSQHATSEEEQQSHVRRVNWERSQKWVPRVSSCHCGWVEAQVRNMTVVIFAIIFQPWNLSSFIIFFQENSCNALELVGWAPSTLYTLGCHF